MQGMNLAIMKDVFLSGIVRIIDSRGATLGTGFLVSSTGLIITCSHVIQSESSQRRGESHPDQVQIEFYLSKRKIIARVESSGWCPYDKGDVAILQAAEAIDASAVPLSLGSLDEYQTHAFRSFGFPEAGMMDGIHSTGRIKGYIYESSCLIMQLESSELTLGHSGSPVFDVETDQVVGMVTSVYQSSGKLRDTAFAIPTQVLLQVWPQLHYLRDSPPISARQAISIVPIPPKPDLVHHISLHTNFTGRLQERQKLTEWFSNGPEPVMALTAIGGTGKSALARIWVLKDVLNSSAPGLPNDSPEISIRCHLPDEKRPSGVLWWSFDAADASFSRFLDEAISYTSSGQENPLNFPYTFDKIRLLLQYLSQNRFLIILDGLEKELRAYSALESAYRGDTFKHDSQQTFRTCSNPHLANFLCQFAENEILSHLLITTRIFPLELENLAGCRKEDLSSLSLEETIEFFKARRIEADRAQIRQVCEPIGYHPLTLHLIAGLIAKDTQYPGDIRVAYHYVESKGMQSEIERILDVSYRNLNEIYQNLLSCIAAFRSPVEFSVIAAISPITNLREALIELRDRGLLEFDPLTGSHYLHPIIRQYAYDRLINKTAIHTQMKDYYSSILKSHTIKLINDISPLIELYHHTLKAGSLDEAWNIYSNYLRNPLYYQFGDYLTDLQLLKAMPLSSDGLPCLSRPENKNWWLIYASMCYERTGSPENGIELLQKAIQLDLTTGNLQNLASAQIPYSMLCCDIGQIAIAERTIRESINIFDREGNANWRGISHRSLGRVLIWKGEYKLAETELNLAQQIYGDENKFLHGRSVALIYRSLLSLWQGMAQQAFEFAYEANQLSQKGILEREKIKSTWLMGASSLYLSHKDFHANKYLEDALNQCRKVSLIEIEGDILLTWAEWYRLSGNYLSAKKFAEDGLVLAKRCHYRTREADAENMLAAIALDRAEYEVIRLHAQKAYQLSWCDGPSHSYYLGLQKAQAMLTQLGQ